MNRQLVFNKVAKHLLTQNSRATVEGGHSCLYRAENGNKCAIGCLIPDEMYDTDMESKGVDLLLREFPALVTFLKVEGAADVEFLNDLQRIHDDTPPAGWLTELKYFAELEGLIYEVDKETI